MPKHSLAARFLHFMVHECSISFRIFANCLWAQNQRCNYRTTEYRQINRNSHRQKKLFAFLIAFKTNFYYFKEMAVLAYNRQILVIGDVFCVQVNAMSTQSVQRNCSKCLVLLKVCFNNLYNKYEEIICQNVRNVPFAVIEFPFFLEQA